MWGTRLFSEVPIGTLAKNYSLLYRRLAWDKPSKTGFAIQIAAQVIIRISMAVKYSQIQRMLESKMLTLNLSSHTGAA